MAILKADLHLHSTQSDGSLSPAKLIACAAALGIEVLSFTEHDTMQGFAAAEEAAIRRGIRLIPGVELSTIDPSTGRKVHILGYGIKDPQSIEAACSPLQKQKNEAAAIMVDELRKLGYPLDLADVAAYAGKTGILYRQHVMHALCDRGYETAIYGKLYQRLYHTAFSMNLRYMSSSEAVKLIAAAGGLAVLAHPYQYDSLASIPELITHGLKGMEVFYPGYNQRQRKGLLDLVRQHHLFVTGGSDAHGLYSEKAQPLGCTKFDLERSHPLLLGSR